MPSLVPGMCRAATVRVLLGVHEELPLRLIAFGLGMVEGVAGAWLQSLAK